ncbi:unnamed protein product [Owenia fusiformis]|uniref:Uncharacterized protein n=1 Tax=Owenia fusiformis TaxID=6347 RepID=A0A8S4PXC4_OWEFU|nr:unnamed protein product [Owenia fusiformis]
MSNTSEKRIVSYFLTESQEKSIKLLFRTKKWKIKKPTNDVILNSIAFSEQSSEHMTIAASQPSDPEGDDEDDTNETRSPYCLQDPCITDEYNAQSSWWPDTPHHPHDINNKFRKVAYKSLWNNERMGFRGIPQPKRTN